MECDESQRFFSVMTYRLVLGCAALLGDDGYGYVTTYVLDYHIRTRWVGKVDITF